MRRRSVLAYGGIALTLASCSANTHRGAAAHSPPAAPAHASLVPRATPAAARTAGRADQPARLLVESASFLDPRTGWVWGPASWPAAAPVPGVLAVTSNGGASWTTVASPGGDGSAFDGHSLQLTHVRFADSRHGYIYGQQLYATDDAGRHWRRIAVAGTVEQLQVSNGLIYAVVAGCARPDCATASLLRGAEGGSRLTRVPGVPAFGRDGAHLAAAGNELSLLIQPHGHYTRYKIWADSAGSWRSYSTPCVGLHAAIADVPPTGIALACGVGAGAGNETKTFYASNDGARSWRRTANVGFTSGYVDSLATNSSSSWVLGESRGTLLVSHDHGRTWRNATVRGASGVEGFTDVQFLNARDAVAISGTFNGDLLAMSHDRGYTWTTHVFHPVSGPH